MPNIPDGNSYTQSLGEGMQIGLGWAQNRERRREALVEEQARQQQLGMAQQEQAIRNAQAAREAQDYIATQQAQKSYQDRVQELTAPPAAEDTGVPPEERGAVGQGMTQEQAHRRAMSEMMSRLPASQWGKFAPIQAAQAREAYYEANPEWREKVAEIAAKAREEAARIRAEEAAKRTEEVARHNQEVEALHKAAAEKGLQPLYDPETKKFIGFASAAGAPHFKPAEKSATDPIAAALGGAASAASETTNDIPPVPKSPADAKVGQSYRLADGRIGKWNGKTFTIGQ